MTIAVRWMLAQPDLALELKGGAQGVGREITFAHATELLDPFRWLTGGEFILTTGIRLPSTQQKRGRYLRMLDAAGVAAVGLTVSTPRSRPIWWPSPTRSDSR